MDLILTGDERQPCEELKEVYDAASAALQLIDKGFTLEKVDELTQKLRISMCEMCDNFDSKDRRCLACCCPMDFKTTLKFDPIKGFFKKTLVECPLQKW